MPASYILSALFIIVGMVAAVMARKLTVMAAITGGVVAAAIFAGGGFTGLAMLAAFFVLGTIATAHKKQTKQQITIPADHDSRRTTGQVLANGGMAAIAGAMAYGFNAYTEVWQLMLAAALASATADTLSSELGMVYGRRFFNILTLKPDAKGLDGVVSIEGLLIGIAGSLLIALIYAFGAGLNNYIAVIVIAGTVGNISDSVLGAALERKDIIGNNVVNFLNTFFAALVAWLLV